MIFAQAFLGLAVIALIIQVFVSLVWLAIIRKFHWSLFVPEALVAMFAIGSFLVMLFSLSDNESPGDSIALLFSASFSIPITISAFIASIIVIFITSIFKSKKKVEDVIEWE